MDGVGGRPGWKDEGVEMNRDRGCPRQENRGGGPDQPQRALLEEPGPVESASCELLHTDMLAHLPGADVEAQWHPPLARGHTASWNQRSHRPGFQSQSFSGAPGGIWMVWMPQTGSVGRGLKPVKVQLVGGEQTGHGGGGMAGPRNPCLGPEGWLRAWAEEVRDGCSMGTQASTIPQRGHGSAGARAVSLSCLPPPRTWGALKHSCGRSPSATRTLDCPILALTIDKTKRQAQGGYTPP